MTELKFLIGVEQVFGKVFVEPMQRGEACEQDLRFAVPIDLVFTGNEYVRATLFKLNVDVFLRGHEYKGDSGFEITVVV